MVSTVPKIAGSLLALTLAAGFCTARPDFKTFAPELEVLITRLDSDDPIDRQAACTELHEFNTADLNTIFEIMKRPKLSLEQRKRLECAARHPFESAPRAGLGVSFDRAVDDGSVRIIGTVDRPGFHAHEVLKPGDTVRELDGISVHTQEQARSIILSHDPGDTLDILVVRQGTPVRAAIKLGNFTDLDVGMPANIGRNAVPGRDLDAAFKVRLLRELGDQAKQCGAAPIDAGFNAETWDGLYRKLQNTRNQRIEKDGRIPLTTVPILNAGGIGRITAVDVLHQPIKRPGNRITMQDREFLVSAIAQSKAMLKERLAFVDNLKVALEKPDLGARQQATLRDQLFSTQDIITKIEQQILEFERLLNGR